MGKRFARVLERVRHRYQDFSPTPAAEHLAGKSYDLLIQDEWVPVYPNEKMWRESGFAAENSQGGFALALLRQPKMALLYRGLSQLNPKAISELVSAVGLRTLNDKYADLLYHYGPALAVLGMHAVVPGGVKAEPIWAQMAGAPP